LISLTSGIMSTRTQQPIVTGTSVLALKYADGVMMLADTLGSYGSMAMFTSFNRLKAVNSHTFVGCSGDLSDFQFLSDRLKQAAITDFTADDGHTLSASEIYNYVHRLLYQRRSKMDPLWNSVIVAGYDKSAGGSSSQTGNAAAESKDNTSGAGEHAFLGYVDLNGTHFTDNYVTSGYGHYLALPIIRKGWRPNMPEAEARALLEHAMTVLIYRDCRTINKFSIGKVTKAGVALNWFNGGEAGYSLPTEWNFKRFQFPSLTKESDYPRLLAASNASSSDEKKADDMDTK